MSASGDNVPDAFKTSPSGTVTFVFTDIEGSTQRWESHRAAMQTALRRHDELLRSAIADHHGYVFKTIGDAFCAAFANPADAVAAIQAAQQAIAAEDFSGVDGLRVRAAIHTGTADEREGDYFGPAVNRVARLLAVGHGGQVLISGVSTDLLHDDLPREASLLDLGEHKLRDLNRPERVYQLVAPGLVGEFPPLRSLDALPNNLPRMPNSFVGREAELEEIAGLIETNQLVTLVGAGGVGKTRTALQCAANLLDRSPDGVWLIELAPLTSGDYIPSLIAQATATPLAQDGDPVDNLTLALKSKRMLLVFDNCEHVVESASRVIAALLRNCPHMKILATSRQALGIAAEATYRMPSLAVPDEATISPPTAIAALAYASIALFVDRARAGDQRFRLTDENALIVADICRRLDGIPLAIELAASRVKLLSLRQLRDRLDERFRVLTGGSRDALPRQQTLRALIDWSHDLLDERERLLFRRLGIFVNGFSLEGAVAVGHLDELEVFDVLASLVDKSLVVAEPHGDSPRYRLLESTRAYATEKLRDAGERERMASRHLNYLRERFAVVAARVDSSGRESEKAEAFGTELEDVRAALDEALKRGDSLSGAALLADIGDAWLALGLYREGVARSESYLAVLPRCESLLLALISTTLSRLLADAIWKARALEIAVEAIAYARASGDSRALADALGHYSWVNLTIDRTDDAEAALDEAEAIAGGSTSLRLQLLRSRAFLSHARNDSDTAAAMWEQLCREHRSLGNVRAERQCVLSLAEVEHGRGRTQRAIALVREILHGAPNFVGHDTTLYSNLAAYLIVTGDLVGSADAARKAIALCAERDPGHGQAAFAIEHLALVRALRADFERAALLAGYVDAAVQRYGSKREFTETTTHDKLAALLSERLLPDELARLRAQGSALKPEEAITLSLEEQ